MMLFIFFQADFGIIEIPDESSVDECDSKTVKEPNENVTPKYEKVVNDETVKPVINSEKIDNNNTKKTSEDNSDNCTGKTDEKISKKQKEEVAAPTKKANKVCSIF